MVSVPGVASHRPPGLQDASDPDALGEAIHEAADMINRAKQPVDILSWQFSRIPEILGSGTGFIIETEEQLDAALQAAGAYTDSFSILDIHLSPDDISPALQRMTHMLGKRVK